MNLLNLPTLNKHSGFTIFEILITISIIGLVSVFGFTNLITSREKVSLIGAATELTSLLDTARDYSVRNTDRKYYGVKVANNNLILMCYSCIPAESPVKTNAFPESIELTGWPAGNKIIFLPNSGRAASPTPNQPHTDIVTLTLESKNWRINVVVPALGSSYTSEIEQI